MQLERATQYGSKFYAYEESMCQHLNNIKLLSLLKNDPNKLSSMPENVA